MPREIDKQSDDEDYLLQIRPQFREPDNRRLNFLHSSSSICIVGQRSIVTYKVLSYIVLLNTVTFAACANPPLATD